MFRRSVKKKSKLADRGNDEYLFFHSFSAAVCK